MPPILCKHNGSYKQRQYWYFLATDPDWKCSSSCYYGYLLRRTRLLLASFSVSAVWITCNLTFMVTKNIVFVWQHRWNSCTHMWKDTYFWDPNLLFCRSLSLNYSVQTPQTPRNFHPGGGQTEVERWQSTQVAYLNEHTRCACCRNAAPPPSPPRYWHLKRNYSRNTQTMHFAPSEYHFKCSWGMGFSQSLCLCIVTGPAHHYIRVMGWVFMVCLRCCASQ